MLSQLQKLILTKKQLMTNGDTSLFKTFKIKKIDHQMNKIAKRYAHLSAKKMYKDSYELCRSIIEANFE